MPSRFEPHFSHRFRVRFYECDNMGVVHHSNYVRYFETARTEMMRAVEMSYHEVERRGLAIVVTDYQVHCEAPARFDDELIVHARMVFMSRTRARLSYRVERADDQRIIVRGETGHGAMTLEGRPTRMPEIMLEWARRYGLSIEKGRGKPRELIRRAVSRGRRATRRS